MQSKPKSSKPKTKIPIKYPKNKPWLKDKTRAPFSSTDQPEGAGRPKGSVSIVHHLRALLEKNNQAEAVACGASLVKNFHKGNPVVIKEVLGRMDGVLAEKTEVEHTFKNLSDDELDTLIDTLQGGGKK